MKKQLVIYLIMILALAACGGSSDETPTQESTTSTDTEAEVATTVSLGEIPCPAISGTPLTITSGGIGVELNITLPDGWQQNTSTPFILMGDGGSVAVSSLSSSGIYRTALARAEEAATFEDDPYMIETFTLNGNNAAVLNYTNELDTLYVEFNADTILQFQMQPSSPDITPAREHILGLVCSAFAG